MPLSKIKNNKDQPNKQSSNQVIKYLILILASIAIIQIFSVILIASNPQAYNQSRSPRLKTIARKLLNKKQTEINPSNDEHYKSPEIKVVSPADETVFKPEETITVVVQSGTGISFKEVVLLFRGNFRAKSVTPPIDEDPPFEFMVTLPNKVGPVILEAYGRDQTDKVFRTEVTLNLKSTATLQEIIPLTEELVFDFYEEESLAIWGLYSDGAERDITSSSTGTAYKTLSGTENVVKISPDGLVSPQGNGQETIIISNSGIIKTIPVNVQITNSEPILAPIGDLSVEAGTVLDVPLSVADPDNEDIITLTADNDSLPIFAQIIDNGDRTGMLRIAPTISDTGTFTGVYIYATDNGTPSLADYKNITITVTAPAME